MEINQKILSEWRTTDAAASLREFKEFREALNYYSGQQLPPQMVSDLKSRARPVFFENVFQAILNVFLGRKQQSLTQINVTGVQENDQHLANLVNQILNSFWSKREFLQALLARDKNLLCGCGVFELMPVRTKSGNITLELRNLDADTLAIDAYSMKADASDARRFHKTLNLPFDEAKKIFGSKTICTAPDTYEPRTEVIESWIKVDGKWDRYFWQDDGGAIIKTERAILCNGELSPFIVRKFKQDENGGFFGLFRDLKPLQDEINFNENKQSDLIANLQVFFEDDAVNNPNEFASAIDNNDAAIMVNSRAIQAGKIKINSNTDKIQILNSKTNEKRELMRMISGISEDIFGSTNQNQQTQTFKREFSEISLKIFLGASELMDLELCEKMLKLIQFYFSGAQVFSMVDERFVNHYVEITGEEFQKIKIGDFDITLNVTPQMSIENNNFGAWSQIIQAVKDTSPELALKLLPPMFKSLRNPYAADVEAAINEILQQQSENANSEFEQTKQQLIIEKAKREIENIQADTQKKLGQSDVATTIAVGNLNGTNTSTQQVRNGGANGGTTDLRS